MHQPYGPVTRSVGGAMLRGAGAVLLYVLQLPSVAQGPSQRHGLLIRVCGATQVVRHLQLDDVRSSHGSRHGSLSLCYQYRMRDDLSMGPGMSISWGSYRVALNGSFNSASGPVELAVETWSPMIEFPFARSVGGKRLNTDPLQLWWEARYRWLERSALELELSGLAGVLPPNSSGWGTGAELVPGPSSTRYYADTYWGDGWHLLLGLGADLCFKLRNAGRITVGGEWRGTLTKYYGYRLSSYTIAGQRETVQQRGALSWISVRLGYKFQWK